MVDYLASNGLLQSLAVFLPESGLGTGRISSSTNSSINSSSANNKATAGGAGAAAAAAATAAGRRFLAPSALSREDVLQGLPVPADSALFRRVISRAAWGCGRGRDDGANGSSSGSGGKDGATASISGSGSTSAPAMVLTTMSATDAAAGGKGEARGRGEAQASPGGVQQRRVGGLLEALVAEVAARSRAVAVDSNTQTDEPGRSHKESLGEGWDVRAGFVFSGDG